MGENESRVCLPWLVGESTQAGKPSPAAEGVCQSGSVSLHQLLLDRRTVHDYREQALPNGALQRALRAALAAPNHRMTEPWRFVRVGPQTRAKLVEIAIALKTRPESELSDSALQRLQDKILRPAELLVVCQIPQEKPEVAREDYAAVACAVQNLMLSLSAEGVGSKWSTGGITQDPRTLQLLGMKPEEGEIVGFLWAGYPESESVPKPRRRKGVSDVLRELP